MPPTEATLKLWIVLSRAFSAVAAHVRADVARHGLSPTEFGALEVLYHKGPLLVGEVKRKILVSSGGITYVIDRLAEKGLVERRDCPEDRRASYAAITEAGVEMMKEIFPLHLETLERALSGLSESEKEEATRLLRTLGLAAAAAPTPSRQRGDGTAGASDRTPAPGVPAPLTTATGRVDSPPA